MNRFRTPRLLAGPAVGLVVLGAAAAGCSADERDQPPPAATPQVLSVADVCAGLFSDEGGKGVERVLESTRFLVRAEERNPDVRAVAKAMEDAYRSGRNIQNMPQPVCEAAGETKDSGFIPSLRIMFTAYSKHAGEPPDFPGVSDSGVKVSTRQKANQLAFDCVSSRVGSTQDVPLRIRVDFQERWDESKGAAALSRDYMAVTHSAALAVAKELGCANDGGLPARADGLPQPEDRP
ncbi:hypothetical protein [Streptomyces sp. NPDC048349]|uniref:hypothetical protein n=1 Tax=Streptomyces sp. NPDC048349 TaxID=3155486 RepID=UPI003423E710